MSALLLAGYAILLPFQFPISESLRISLADPLLLGAIVLNLHKLRIRRDAVSIWHVLLFASFIFGAAWTLATDGYLTSYALFNKFAGVTWLFAGYLALTWLLRDAADAHRAVRIFATSVVVANVLFMVAFLAGWEIPVFIQDQARLSGAMFDANAYAGLLVVAFVSVGGLARLGRSRLFWEFASISLLIGVLLTNSRTAWISLSVVLLLLMWIYPKQMLPTILILGAIVVFAGWFTVYGQDAAELAQRSNTIAARFELNEVAMGTFMQQPLTGAGLGAFEAELGTIPHTTFFWLLADLGIVAGIAFLGLGWWVIREGLRRIRDAHIEQRTLVIALIVAHISMLIISVGIEALMQRHWWFVMALVVVAARRTEMDPAHLQSYPILVEREPRLATPK